MEGPGGMPLGVVGACSGPYGAPPVVPVAPDRCPYTVPSITGRGSRTPGPRGSYYPIPSRRWYLLETVEARLHGRVIVSVFAGSFVVLAEGFNSWGGRRYDDFVPEEATKTAPSGDETT